MWQGISCWRVWGAWAIQYWTYFGFGKLFLLQAVASIIAKINPHICRVAANSQKVPIHIRLQYQKTSIGKLSIKHLCLKRSLLRSSILQPFINLRASQISYHIWQGLHLLNSKPTKRLQIHHVLIKLLQNRSGQQCLCCCRYRIGDLRPNGPEIK